MGTLWTFCCNYDDRQDDDDDVRFFGVLTHSISETCTHLSVAMS